MPVTWLLRRSSSDLPAAFDLVRWVYVSAVVLDVGTTLVAVPLGADTASPGGPWVITESLAVVAAVVALVWRWTHLGVVLTLLVAVASAIDPSGSQLWVELLVVVMAGVRADRRQLSFIAVAGLVYTLVFGLRAEHYHPGWFRPLMVEFGILWVVCLAIGFGVRGVLATYERRRHSVAEAARENAQIRAVERATLADELQRVVLGGLAAIGDELGSPAARSQDAAALRGLLARVDDLSRSVLTELRTLLEVLRRPVDEGSAGSPDSVGSGASRRRLVSWVTGRTVRAVMASALGLAAAGSLLLDAGAPTSGDVVQRALGLAAWALAAWSPRWSVPVAIGAMVLAVVAPTGQYWDLIAMAALTLVATIGLGPRRLWAVLVGLTTYDVLTTLTWPGDVYLRATSPPYIAVPALLVGLAAHHFRSEHRQSQEALAALLLQRRRLGDDERSATARDLHDVVGHQLSVTTLLVLSTADSDDPAVLRRTLVKVRRSADAARAELVELVADMRGGVAPHGSLPPPTDAVLTLPGLAEQLVDQLADHGHRASLDLDPDAERLDDTTRRTLARIMQEAATNILRYAPVGGECRFELAAEEAGRVRLTIASALAEETRRSDLSLGWGLRGIRERVDLSGGSFSADARQGRWVLTVELPTAAARTAALV